MKYLISTLLFIFLISSINAQHDLKVIKTNGAQRLFENVKYEKRGDNCYITDENGKVHLFGKNSIDSIISFPDRKLFFVSENILKPIRIERENIRIEEENIRKKIRFERFLSFTYDKLRGELDAVEGIYKSIDNDEGFDYEVVFFKSDMEKREYHGYLLSTTDNDLEEGAVIFTLEQTAQKNLFFNRYQTKKGDAFTNKLATLNGALLTMGIKSFIKMYPTEGGNQSYQEINPMVDWESSGSGVLIDNNGFIATNNHVIKGAKKISVAFQNDNIDYTASIISQNELDDVALIKITDERFEKKLEPIKWNTNFKLGQTVFTLGYPISNKMSDNVKVVDGIVSGMNGKNGVKNFFQTTLPVWYGNSGGPCFNDKGEILGLATQILIDREKKVDNVAYITKSQNILNLSGDLIDKNNIENENMKSITFEDLIEKLIPYSVFIKVNY